MMSEHGDSAVDDEIFVVGHAVVVGTSGSWIVDLGATSHMCTARVTMKCYRGLGRYLLEMVGFSRYLVVGRFAW